MNLTKMPSPDDARANLGERRRRYSLEMYAFHKSMAEGRVGENDRTSSTSSTPSSPGRRAPRRVSSIDDAPAASAPALH
ncbi:hypothetical protein Q5752_005711 [Cryptotrichosporon argae]